MIKFIRQHEKKFLAVFTVGLMLTFTASFGNFGPTQSNPVVGHIGSEKIHAQEMSDSRRWWSRLKRVGILHLPGAEEGQAAKAANLLGPYAAQQIDSDADTFFFLQQEAKKMGLVASQDSVKEYMANQDTLTDQSAAEDVQDTQQAFAALSLVQAGYQRAVAAMKLPAPQLKYAQAMFTQTITLKYISFDANEFKSAVTAPTPDQLKQQFEKYKNTLPDQPTPAEPSGFGYMVPPRVKLEFLSIMRSDLHAAVIASQSPKDWEFAARIAYNRNLSDYPTTKPADASALPLGVAAPSTQPTSKPAPMDFAYYKQEIISKLTDEAESKLLDDVQAKVATTLQTDWAAYRAAVSPTTKPTTQPADGPATALGVPYNSPEYLPKLALTIQKEFKVLPTVQRLADKWLAAADISALPGLGSTELVVDPERGQGLTLSEFVMGYLDGFGHKASDRDLAPTLSVLSPSPALTDLSRNQHFFRVIADDAAHPLDDMSTVAAKVEQDFRAAAAEAMAKQQADKLLATVKASNLDAAAVSIGRKVFLSGPISAQGIRPTPELSLKPASNAILTQAAFDLLKSGDDVTSGKVVSVVELPADGKVLVISPSIVAPTYPADQGYAVENQITREILRQADPEFMLRWFDPKEVKKRVGYESDETKKKDANG